MPFCAFIGDEVSAAGFRLAGIEVHVPEVEETARLFRRLLTEVELLLITAELAAHLPEGEFCRALTAERPLVLAIPDVRGRVAPPDLSLRIRRQLGMAT